MSVAKNRTRMSLKLSAVIAGMALVFAPSVANAAEDGETDPVVATEEVADSEAEETTEEATEPVVEEVVKPAPVVEAPVSTPEPEPVPATEPATETSTSPEPAPSVEAPAPAAAQEAEAESDEGQASDGTSVPEAKPAVVSDEDGEEDGEEDSDTCEMIIPLVPTRTGNIVNVPIVKYVDYIIRETGEFAVGETVIPKGGITIVAVPADEDHCTPSSGYEWRYEYDASVDPDPDLTEVTPSSPDRVEGENFVTINAQEGVIYTDAVTGDTLAGKVNIPESGLSVKATPAEGYVFTDNAVDVWLYEYFTPDQPDLIVAYPEDFLAGVPACSDFSIPKTVGVDYVLSAEEDGDILTITITATPKDGYKFEGEQVRVWSHEYDQSKCGAVDPTDPTNPGTDPGTNPSGPDNSGNGGNNGNDTGSGNGGNILPDLVTPKPIKPVVSTPVAEPAAHNELPYTGANVGAMVLAGLVSIGAGVVLVARRRNV